MLPADEPDIWKVTNVRVETIDERGSINIGVDPKEGPPYFFFRLIECYDGLLEFYVTAEGTPHQYFSFNTAQLIGYSWRCYEEANQTTEEVTE